MTVNNQIEMLEETIDKGIAEKQQKKAEKAAKKAAMKAAIKAAEKAEKAETIAAKAAEDAKLKEQRVAALLSFNQKYGNENWDGENGKGETLTAWAERVC